MKKLLFCLLLAGCGYSPIDSYNQYIIISKVEKNNSSCFYYGTGNGSAVKTLVSASFKFIDTCGKFQIGDTVKFVKR